MKKLQSTLDMLRKQVKKCLMEYFHLSKSMIKNIREYTKSGRAYLINVLKELHPSVLNAAKDIEAIGLSIKMHVDQFLDKYINSFTKNIGNSSMIINDFVAEIMKNIENFKEEALSCLEQLQAFTEILSAYKKYLTWLEQMHLLKKISSLHQKAYR